MTSSTDTKPTKAEFMRLMRFPAEWGKWEMYPDELFELQWREYQPGAERASEHFRNGAFHWWLNRKVGQQERQRLATLAELDPDKPMGTDVLSYLLKGSN